MAIMNVDVSIDKSENLLIFKVTDHVREFVYNYNYNLANVSHINTLCIFIHNGNELVINKNPKNYLIINNNKINIITENSSVNQVGEVNIKKLHWDVTKLLYENDYIDYKIFFMPSKSIMQNYKFKKISITTDDLINQRSKLKKSKKLVNILSEQSVEQLVEQSNDQLNEQSVEQSVEHSSEQLVEHSSEQLVEQSVEQSSEQLGEQSNEQSSEQLVEQSSEQLVEQSNEQLNEQLGEQ